MAVALVQAAASDGMAAVQTVEEGRGLDGDKKSLLNHDVENKSRDDDEDDDDDASHPHKHSELRDAASTVSLTFRRGGPLATRQQHLKALGPFIIDRAYDAWDKSWVAGASASFKQASLRDALDAASIRVPPKRVLLLGCGRHANLLREVELVESKFPDAAQIEFVGLDVIAFADEPLQPENVTRVTALYSDMADLQDDSFDLAIASESLYRVQDMKDLSCELDRVLAEGAAFIAMQTFSEHVVRELAVQLNNASCIEVRECGNAGDDGGELIRLMAIKTSDPRKISLPPQPYKTNSAYAPKRVFLNYRMIARNVEGQCVRGRTVVVHAFSFTLRATVKVPHRLLLQRPLSDGVGHQHAPGDGSVSCAGSAEPRRSPVQGAPTAGSGETHRRSSPGTGGSTRLATVSAAERARRGARDRAAKSS